MLEQTRIFGLTDHTQKFLFPFATPEWIEIKFNVSLLLNEEKEFFEKSVLLLTLLVALVYPQPQNKLIAMMVH